MHVYTRNTAINVKIMTAEHCVECFQNAVGVGLLSDIRPAIHKQPSTKDDEAAKQVRLSHLV